MIQRDLFESISPPLHAMINSKLKENAEGKAHIDDVEWEVFVGFCEYAYTEDHIHSSPSAVTAEGPIADFHRGNSRDHSSAS